MEGSALSLPWKATHPCIDGGSPTRRQPFFPSSASAMPSTTSRYFHPPPSATPPGLISQSLRPFLLFPAHFYMKDGSNSNFQHKK